MPLIERALQGVWKWIAVWYSLYLAGLARVSPINTKHHDLEVQVHGPCRCYNLNRIATMD